MTEIRLSFLHVSSPSSRELVLLLVPAGRVHVEVQAVLVALEVGEWAQLARLEAHGLEGRAVTDTGPFLKRPGVQNRFCGQHSIAGKT